MSIGTGIGIGFSSRRQRATTGTIPVVTTGAQTVTFQRLDVATGTEITIDWGDSSSDVYTDANNGSTKTHAYAGAGSYEVKVSDARNLTDVDLRSSLIVGFDSSFFKSCGDNLDRVYLTATIVNPYINSADMAHLKLSHQLYLYFTQSGIYVVNSDHFKAYMLSSILVLYFNQAGTYNINSDHFKNYTLSTTLYLYFSQSGTYNINRADITFVRVPSVTINIPSLSTSTDDILLGFYDRLPSKTNNGGTMILSGCPAPTGVYEANSNCATDPNGGKGAAHELLNDGCGRASDPAKLWASVTVEGGLP